MFELSPECAIAYSKFITIFVCSWPPSKGVSKYRNVLFNIKWCISWLLGMCLVIPLIYAAYIDRKNILELTKSLCLAVACGQCMIKMILCKLQHDRFQFLFDEVEHYVKSAAAYEREIFSSYIKKCASIHLTLNIFALLGSIGVILGPLVLPQNLPTDAKYPFSVETHPIYEIVYFDQAFAGILCSSITAIDCQVAMLLWYSVARLEILGIEMKNIKTIYQLCICVRKHQFLLWFINEIFTAGRYLVATTVIMTTMAVILGGVHIVGNEPMLVKLQFVIVVGGLSMLLYVTAWPSEMLMRMCENIGWEIYTSKWNNNSKKLNRCIQFIIQRSNKPVVISVKGIYPALSLNYYATFLSKSLSYFTTLRILLTKIES